jgi:glycosyltransferase involved in cell wall biosynthesis
LSPKTNISVIFTTFNEAHNIKAAIDTVFEWADDIIVVDSFSTDATIDIIKSYPTIRLFQRKYEGPANQKNWAIPQAKHAWVLLMDADERTTTEMRLEITEILLRYEIPIPSGRGSENTLQSKNFDCYWMGFTHFFMGKKVRYSGWQNDKTIRLIQRDKCHYNDNRVHEEINMDGLNVGYIKNKFPHYTFKDIQHFVAKQERYARWSAEDHDLKTGQITYFHLFFKPIFRFFKHFVLKKGFLDGKVGFVISAVAAWSVFLRYVYLIEKRGKE